MAATFTPAAAFDTAKVFVKQPGTSPVDNVKVAICQDASSHLWNLAPWPWTIGLATAVTVTAAQDLTFTKPSDFLRLERVWLVTTEGATPLTISAAEPVMTIVGTPKSVAYVSSGGDKLRLNCVYPTLPSPTNSPTLRVIYKKQAPDLTSATGTAGALVMDDDYYYVYRSLVKFYTYQWSDDPRAGGAAVQMAADGRLQTSYSGQLAQAMAEVEELRKRLPVLTMLDDTPGLKKD